MTPGELLKGILALVPGVLTATMMGDVQDGCFPWVGVESDRKRYLRCPGSTAWMSPSVFGYTEMKRNTMSVAALAGRLLIDTSPQNARAHMQHTAPGPFNRPSIGYALKDWGIRPEQRSLR